MGAGAAGAVAITLVAQSVVFGDPFTTPYHWVHDGLDASRDAISLSDLPDHAVGVFVTGDREVLFRVEPILRDMPWIILAPAGLFLLVRNRHPQRFAFVVASLVGLASTITYLAWVFGGTPDLMIWNIRFHVPWFPLWAILAAVAVERLVVRSAETARRGERAAPASDREEDRHPAPG